MVDAFAGQRQQVQRNNRANYTRNMALSREQVVERESEDVLRLRQQFKQGFA